jgi:hypothetical protein
VSAQARALDAVNQLEKAARRDAEASSGGASTRVLLGRLATIREDADTIRAAITAEMVSEEWGVRADDGYTIYDSSTEHFARVKADKTGLPLVSRLVSAWRDRS